MTIPLPLDDDGGAPRFVLAHSLSVDLGLGRAVVKRVVGVGRTTVVKAPAPTLLSVLAHFQSPQTRESLLASELGEKSSELDRLFDVLIARQILIREAAATNALPTQAGKEIATDVDSLARSLWITADQIARDVHALAPLLQSGPLCDVAGRLTACHEIACELENAVASQRQASVERQLSALAAAGRLSGNGVLRLHLGCGTVRLPDWINVDLDEADLRMDLRWDLPFASETVDFVYMGHLLEHLNYKDEALAVVKQIRRVLKPGGIARIVVPNIGAFLRAYAANDRVFFADFCRQWGYEGRSTLLSSFLHYAGAGAFPGVLDAHRFGYDFDTLEDLLREAGFAQVEARDWMESSFSELRVDHSWAASARGNNQDFSLIVEAS